MRESSRTAGPVAVMTDGSTMGEIVTSANDGTKSCCGTRRRSIVLFRLGSIGAWAGHEGRLTETSGDRSGAPSAGARAMSCNARRVPSTVPPMRLSSSRICRAAFHDLFPG